MTQIDVTNSPYWTGGKRENLEDGRVARFGRRFTGSDGNAEKEAEKEGGEEADNEAPSVELGENQDAGKR